jgi:hypothetical protein
LCIAFIGIPDYNFRNRAARLDFAFPASHEYRLLLRLNPQLAMLLLA